MGQQAEWTTPLEEQPESYPGALIGYRHFGDTCPLSSVHSKFTYSKVEENEWWEAKCGTGKDTSPSLDHDAPEANCKCGFYVNYYPQNSFYDKSYDKTYPRGVVEASGRVILGQKGFRAQKVRLVALFPVRFDLGMYVAEVFPWVRLFTDIDKMYEAYPQEDLTSLIGEDTVKRNTESSLWKSIVDQSTFTTFDWQNAALQYDYRTLLNTYTASRYALSYITPQGGSPNGVEQYRLSNGAELVFAPGYDLIRITIPGYASHSYLSFLINDPTSIQPNSYQFQTLEYRISQLHDMHVTKDSVTDRLVRLEFSDQRTAYQFDFIAGTYSMTQKR